MGTYEYSDEEIEEIYEESFQLLKPILDAMNDLLIPAGFKSERFLFNREISNDIVQVIDVQPGIGFMRDKFTINIGIWYSFAPPICEYKKDDKLIPEIYCQERERIGFLTRAGDYWWDTEKFSIAEIIEEVLSDLKKVLKNFLNHPPNNSK